VARFDRVLGWLLTRGLRPHEEVLGCDDGYGGLDGERWSRMTSHNLGERRARAVWNWLERASSRIGLVSIQTTHFNALGSCGRLSRTQWPRSGHHARPSHRVVLTKQ